MKTDYRNIIFTCLLLIVLVLLPYSQVRNHEFVDLDDYDYLVENHHIKNGLTLDGLIWAFSFQQGDNSYWRPLTWLSHMLDFEFFGNDAGWHHLTNLLLHLLNTLLLYALLFIMTGKSGRSALVAALFALHPINAESVAWVTERNNVLCTAVGMITLLFYVWYVSRPSFNRYLLTFLSFLLCLMVKPILVTLPFLMILLDFWPLYRFGHGHSEHQNQKGKLKQLISEKFPLIILSFVAIWFSMHRHGSPISIEQVSIQLRLSNAVVSYVQYLFNLFYPLNLTAFYPFPKMIPIWKIAGALSVLLSISGIVTVWARKMPYLFVGWFWYAGTMFPKIGLVQVGLWPALADRWAYFPAIGLFIMVSWLGLDYLNKQSSISKKQIAYISLIACGVLCFLTWKQVGYWSNSTRLFERMVEKTHDNYMAHNNLGTVLLSQERYDDAEIHFLRAIEIKPDFEIPYVNMGKVTYTKGNIEEAIEYYEKAIAIRPDYYAAHLSLGNLYLRTADYQKSWKYYTEAVRINSDGALPYNGMGGVLTKIGRLDDAAKMYIKALAIDPSYEPAKQNLERVMTIIRSRHTDSTTPVDPYSTN
jgi:protein O-mannosyl-transferase